MFPFTIISETMLTEGAAGATVGQSLTAASHCRN